MSGADITIRRMTADDVPAVYAVEVSSFAVPWSMQSFLDEMEKNVCARYMVAEKNKEIIAYAGAWIVLEEGHITNVAVHAAQRGQGVGTQVVQALMQYAANLGVQYMTLEVRKSNHAAQALYMRLGFVELGVRKRYYEDNGEDALLLVCQNMPPVDAAFEDR